MSKPFIFFAILNLMILPASLRAQKNAGTEFIWKIAGELPSDASGIPSIGFAGATAGYHNNHLIVAGGANFPDKMPWEGGKKKYTSNIVVFKKLPNKLQLIAKRFSLPTPLAYATSCTTPIGVFYGGGENEQGIQSKAALLKWDNQQSSLTIQSLPNLPIAITNASAVCLQQIVYVAGGEMPAGVSDKLFSLDLSQMEAGWKELPSLPHPVSHAVIIAATINKQTSLFVCGGRMKTPSGISQLYKEVYQYQIIPSKWIQESSLPTSLSAGTGFFLSPNKLVLIGGDQGILFHQTELWLNAIQLEKNDSIKQTILQQKNILQQTHPGFSREILIAEYPAIAWKAANTLPFPTPVTTSLVPVAGGYLIPSGEIRPGVRSPKIISLTLTHLKP
jgi:N-acetylneuraminic acid mutarotase